MRWSLDQVGAITGGLVVGEGLVTSVVTDSREASRGALFVALRGEHADGHEFVDRAFEAGAVGALVERGRLADDASGVEVDDPLEALSLLGAARRRELDLPVVAITGSTGKTTTKDLTAAVLGPSTHAAPRSFNNEIGVPLTVLACPDDAGALVVEVGSRGVGHIVALGPVIRPDVAIITNIGPAHLEMFGDVETVREAKWELVELLGEGGTAVVPVDDPVATRPTQRTLTFGEDPAADVAVVDVTMDDGARASFDLVHDGATVHLTLGVSGRHQPRNAAAAAAAGLALGVSLEVAATRLEGARLSPWRMEVTSAPLGGGAVTVVNDAYNANPTSMRSALETVAAMPGRHVAVLGMMHELGDGSPALHEEIGSLAASLGFTVVVVGDDPGIARGVGVGVHTATDVRSAATLLESLLEPGDVVLVKASRATGLERLPELVGGVRS